MSRFDIYRGDGAIDYYVDVQADFHNHLRTRMVIPALAARKIINQTRGLHVPITIHDQPHYLVTPMMAAMSSSMLGRAVGSATSQSSAITSAIDFLLQGF